MFIHFSDRKIFVKKMETRFFKGGFYRPTLQVKTLSFEISVLRKLTESPHAAWDNTFWWV